MSWLTRAKQIAVNVLGWRTNRKIVVFESDDWGSIRMSNSEARDRLKVKGHEVDNNPYQQYDGLETADDVNLLRQILDAVDDKNGSSGVFTLNYCSANPDFQNIEEFEFSQYYREPFDKTYEHYGEGQRVIDEVKKGEKQGVFNVQFHGAEHLNIKRWMMALQKNDRITKEAFQEGIFSPAIAKSTGYSMEYMDALDFDNENEVEAQIQQLQAGLDIFQNVWQKKPVSFIAPCYRWSKPIEVFLAQAGIKYIQGQRAQLHPKNKPGYAQRKIYRYTGQRNEYGQYYTVRNVIFEPSIHEPLPALTMAKQQIKDAFFMNVPAVVSSHRINYTSRLNRENRDRNLSALKELFKWITESYSDVEYMSSIALGELIEKDRS